MADHRCVFANLGSQVIMSAACSEEKNVVCQIDCMPRKEKTTLSGSTKYDFICVFPLQMLSIVRQASPTPLERKVSAALSGLALSLAPQDKATWTLPTQWSAAGGRAQCSVQTRTGDAWTIQTQRVGTAFEIHASA